MERELRETINKELINKENISYSDLYFEIFNKRISEDESRKRIYGLRDLMHPAFFAQVSPKGVANLDNRTCLARYTE